MKSISSSIIALKSPLEILYPSLCLRCAEPVSPRGALFCPTCLELWTWVEELSCGGHAAACEPFGPAQVLAHRLDRGYFFLADTIASLMLLYWDRLHWPMPTRVLPLTFARFPQWSQSGRQVQLLADRFSQRLLHRPSSSWRPINRLAGEEVLLISLHADLDAFDKAQKILSQGFPRRIRLLSFLSF